MTAPATNWQPGMDITDDRLNASDVQTGTVPVSFSSQTSVTINVTFPEPYPSAPIVMTNIASGAGPTARWGSRAYNVTATGFTLFLFITDAANTAATWSSIPVQWMATL